MKKFLVLCIAICSSVGMVFADPIVELVAPRVQAPKIISDDGSEVKSIPTPQAELKGKPKPQKSVRKKHVPKKPLPVKVDYNKVSKLIEYGYYDEADNILEGAICRNSKDIQAKALWVISLAKQLKLDPAQAELDVLLKKYPDNSNLHYAQGVVYYQRTTSSNMFYRNNTQQLLNNALAEFKKAITADKTNARAYNAAGVISIRLGNNDDAVNYFKKALSIDKTYSMAIDNLGTIDFANGKFKDAEAKFKQALVYNTQNTTAMYHMAQSAMQRQDYTTALTYLNNALYINQDSPAIYNLMGKAYLAQGNEAAAINAFKESIAVKPEFVLSYLDLANIYDRRNDSEFAIEQLKTALSVNPDFYDAKLKIADISLGSGKYKQAIAVYGELVGIEGYNAAALKGLANSYYGLAQTCSNKALIASNKELFTALDCINKAIAANPNDLELHLAKLKLSKLTNQPDISNVELNKIIASQANDLVSLVVKGEAYLMLNDYQNAQKTFNSAIALSQTQDEDLYLSEIFIYHKQYSPAQKVLQKILQTDEKNQQALSDWDYIGKSLKYADNYLKTAQSFLKSGNISAATEYLLRSLAVNPNNAQSHLILAQIYEKQKNYPDAVANYRAYLGLNPQAHDKNKIQKKIKHLDNKL
ncbi:MAG: tetratricopeptide repeat protein [Candidatus Gastranaerophilales bacterium]|nr:tetratricopeptide repeat protein [Candidatus Gastranaerophilales bacterium]